MLDRIDYLMTAGVSFSIETTLATKSYVNLERRAHKQGYNVKLLFFWLESPEMAKLRVAERVAKGGHNIPEDVIERRYYAGIRNLFNLFMNEVDYWAIFMNTKKPMTSIAVGGMAFEKHIIEVELYKKMVEIWQNKR